MKAGLVVIGSTLFCGIATAALAQDIDQIIGRLPSIARSGIAKLAGSEWKKLPESEVACVDQKLQQKNDSVGSLIQKGVFPFDRRVADLRAECRNAAAAPSPGQAEAQASYSIDGLAVGGKAEVASAAYREYKCSPSEQFEGFTWCQRTRNGERRGASTATYSMLHGQDGTIAYVNRRQEPAFVARSEAEKEIQQYSRKFADTARITRMPHRGGHPDALIAVWGKASLEALDAESTKVLAEGKSPRKGLLIDFLGNFARSAKEGLPIYRVTGGAGFVWAASFDQGGRGVLRFAAVDASALSPAASSPPPPAPAPSVALAAAEERIVSAATGPDVSPTIDSLKVELARSAERIAQLEREQAATQRESQPPEAMSALFAGEKAALDASRRTWETRAYRAIALSVFLAALAMFWFARARQAKKRLYQLSQQTKSAPVAASAATAGFAVAAAASGAAAKASHGAEKQRGETKETPTVQQAGAVNQPGESSSGRQSTTVSLSELTPVPSESMVPEAAAPGDGHPGKDTEAGKTLDQGVLVDQLAAALGVQKPAESSAEPAADSAPKNPAEHSVACAEQVSPASNGGDGQEVEQGKNVNDKKEVSPAEAAAA